MEVGEVGLALLPFSALSRLQMCVIGVLQTMHPWRWPGYFLVHVSETPDEGSQGWYLYGWGLLMERCDGVRLRVLVLRIWVV